MSAKFFSAVMLSLQWQTVLAQSINLNVSPSMPNSASPPVDASFPGFAFEQASFYNFSFDAQGNPNKFSQNLINSVMTRTGGIPVIRVGGTSGDMALYDPTQSLPVNKPATNTGPQAYGGLTVGPSYFKAFSNFPNAQFIFMVPLYHRNLNSTIQWAQQGIKYIGNRLQAVEIGNEPNIYPWYSMSNYVSQFNTFVKGLANEIPALRGKVIFQALDTAWGNNDDMSVPNAIAAGINSTKQVRQVAHHYYQGTNQNNGMSELQNQVANHTAIASGLSEYCTGIDYLRQNFPRVPYILSENGNTLGFNYPNQRNNLATALWNVDFQLFSMSIGVARVNMQQILQPGYGMWEPVHSSFGPPMVRANYYSQPFVADFIGYKQNPNVVNIPIPNTDFLSAYAAYVNNKVVRIAIVNMNLWNGQGTRPSQTFTIKGLPDSATSAVIDTLSAPGGAYANDTLSWAGSTWSWQNQGVEETAQTSSDTESPSARISNGAMSLTLKSTSAIIVNVKY